MLTLLNTIGAGIIVLNKEQVLVNLLHNAIKFTPQKGKIITSSVVHDGSVVVSVSTHQNPLVIDKA